MQYTRYLLWLLSALALGSCVSPPDYPDEPVIVYEGLNKQEIRSLSSGIEDSITIQISFTDGDGDISNITDSVDVTLEDSRNPGIFLPVSLPIIPVEGTGNGISGDIFIRVTNVGFTICCENARFICIPDANFPTDEFFYRIRLRDRAGNLSNVVETEPITVLCLP